MLRSLLRFLATTIGLAVLLASHPATAARRDAMPQYGRQQILEQPMDAGRVKLALKQAGRMHGWSVVSEDPNALRLRLNVRNKHFATVDFLNIDDRACDVKYISSENLNYTKDGDYEEIHPNYGRWLETLLRDARVQGNALRELSKQLNTDDAASAPAASF
ncbi:MAG: hypothetical protein QM639_09105 [Rhodocyclaceae bacterium]|jgi:hypothetical protein